MPTGVKTIINLDFKGASKTDIEPPIEDFFSWVNELRNILPADKVWTILAGPWPPRSFPFWENWDALRRENWEVVVVEPNDEKVGTAEIVLEPLLFSPALWLWWDIKKITTVEYFPTKVTVT